MFVYYAKGAAVDTMSYELTLRAAYLKYVLARGRGREGSPAGGGGMGTPHPHPRGLRLF